MSSPPVLARAIERGLSPLGGRRAARLLPRARLGGPMPWVIAIMVALTVLAAGGGLALSNMASSARGEVAGAATMQILQPDPVIRDRQARRTAALLSDDPAVVEVRIVPEAEIAELLEPWLGGGEALEAVPLPALIDVRLTGPATGAEIDRLEQLVARVAPGARMDSQAAWLAPVLGALRSLQWMALGLIALLAFTAAAAVWLAARNALGTNRETIEIVHLLGGNDDQIARIFQRSIMFDAASGGVLGLIAGAAVLWLVGKQFAALESGMVVGGGLDRSDWLVLASIPLAGIAIAVLTARMTVLASLRKML